MWKVQLLLYFSHKIQLFKCSQLFVHCRKVSPSQPSVCMQSYFQLSWQAESIAEVCGTVCEKGICFSCPFSPVLLLSTYLPDVILIGRVVTVESFVEVMMATETHWESWTKYFLSALVHSDNFSLLLCDTRNSATLFFQGMEFHMLRIETCAKVQEGTCV